jgi:hypothetical protein
LSYLATAIFFAIFFIYGVVTGHFPEWRN